MPDASFETNLLKMLAAELYFLSAMTASREMYGKSYFSLGVAEKTTLDGVVWQNVSANLQAITPDLIKPQIDQKPVGFQNPTKPEKADS
ncbi:MAG TPA: hypothetical protein VIH56_04370 [Candidatus Acidoferrales bacterium]